MRMSEPQGTGAARRKLQQKQRWKQKQVTYESWRRLYFRNSSEPDALIAFSAKRSGRSTARRVARRPMRPKPLIPRLVCIVEKSLKRERERERERAEVAARVWR